MTDQTPRTSQEIVAALRALDGKSCVEFCLDPVTGACRCLRYKQSHETDAFYREAADLVERLQQENDSWQATARDMANNAEFYHGLVVRIGELFGVAARTSDDGSIQDSVLALKVPELVEHLQQEHEELTGMHGVADEPITAEEWADVEALRAKMLRTCEEYDIVKAVERAEQAEAKIAQLEQSQAALTEALQKAQATLARLRAWMGEYPNDKYTGEWWLSELKRIEAIEATRPIQGDT